MYGTHTHISVDYESFLMMQHVAPVYQHPSASSILRIVFCLKFLPGFSVPECSLLKTLGGKLEDFMLFGQSPCLLLAQCCLLRL